MIILNKRRFIFEEFSKYDKSILNSNAKIIVIAQLPRYIIEGSLYSALVILTLFLFVYSEENISIYFEGINLTEEIIYKYYENKNTPYAYYDNGTRFVLGTKVAF